MDTDSAAALNPSDYNRAIRKIMPYYDTIHNETIGLVRAIKPNVTCWLDTGCGTGQLVELALPLFPSTLFVLVDPSEAMLGVARSRLGDPSSGRVCFLPPSGSENLAVFQLDARPQVITAILSHHYFSLSERRKAVQLCREILEDGGVFVSFENIDFGVPRFNEIALERWSSYQIELGRTPAEAELHRKRFKTRYFPITIDEHLHLLRTTGFRDSGIFWLSFMQAGFFAIK